MPARPLEGQWLVAEVVHQAEVGVVLANRLGEFGGIVAGSDQTGPVNDTVEGLAGRGDAFVLGASAEFLDRRDQPLERCRRTRSSAARPERKPTRRAPTSAAASTFDLNCSMALRRSVSSRLFSLSFCRRIADWAP